MQTRKQTKKGGNDHGDEGEEKVSFKDIAELEKPPIDDEDAKQGKDSEKSGNKEGDCNLKEIQQRLLVRNPRKEEYEDDDI